MTKNLLKRLPFRFLNRPKIIAFLALNGFISPLTPDQTTAQQDIEKVITPVTSSTADTARTDIPKPLIKTVKVTDHIITAKNNKECIARARIYSNQSENIEFLEESKGLNTLWMTCLAPKKDRSSTPKINEIYCKANTHNDKIECSTASDNLTI